MKKAIRTTGQIAQQVIDDYISPVPKWAKLLRNAGIVIGAIGGTILTSPVMFPAGLVAVAGYMVMGGNFTALVAQGFKK